MKSGRYFLYFLGVLGLLTGCMPMVMPPGAPPAPPTANGAGMYVNWLAGAAACILPIATLIVIAAVVWGIVQLLRRGGFSFSSLWQVEPSAVEVARVRYASGEIDRDEYLRILADLRPEPAKEE